MHSVYTVVGGFALRAPLATSGDISGCHNLEARGECATGLYQPLGV